MEHPLYDDGLIVCDDDGLVVRRYYFPCGSKRIPYTGIRNVERRELAALTGKWRVWGSGDLRHWWNLDPGRPRKSVALVLDVGRRIRPTITPDDPDAVERILVGRTNR
jgi:hypothetical protein